MYLGLVSLHRKSNLPAEESGTEVVRRIGNETQGRSEEAFAADVITEVRSRRGATRGCRVNSGLRCCGLDVEPDLQKIRPIGRHLARDVARSICGPPSPPVSGLCRYFLLYLSQAASDLEQQAIIVSLSGSESDDIAHDLIVFCEVRKCWRQQEIVQVIADLFRMIAGPSGSIEYSPFRRRNRHQSVIQFACHRRNVFVKQQEGCRCFRKILSARARAAEITDVWIVDVLRREGLTGACS